MCKITLRYLCALTQVSIFNKLSWVRLTRVRVGVTRVSCVSIAGVMLCGQGSNAYMVHYVYSVRFSGQSDFLKQKKKKN